MSASAGIPLVADPKRWRPVFVVGMNGSGTTMLVDCLGKHPELYGFPHETRLIPHLVRVASRYGPLDDDDNFRRLWRHAAALTPFRFANGGTPKPLPTGWRSCTRDIAGLLNMLYLTYAQAEGKQRWCEKSPQNAQHLEMLATLYPRARFVHLIRDGRDCAYSFHRRWRRSPELTMVRWKRLIRVARTQGRALGDRYLEIRYEDLTREPERWMRRLCRFLEIEFDAVVLESSQPYLGGARSPHRWRTTGSLVANSGRWREYFPAALAERLEVIGGRVLAEHGYRTDRPRGDDDPPPWRQTLWRLSDACYQFAEEIHAKLRGRIERPWWSILSRPVNAYRQARENRF